MNFDQALATYKFPTQLEDPLKNPVMHINEVWPDCSYNLNTSYGLMGEKQFKVSDNQIVI